LKENENPWQFTGVYGWSESSQKWKTGDLISDLATHSPLPWLIGGDLNEIFFHEEKKGGPLKSQAVIDRFRDSFSDNGLFDLGYSGYAYTRCNFQQHGVVVEEWLD